MRTGISKTRTYSSKYPPILRYFGSPRPGLERSPGRGDLADGPTNVDPLINPDARSDWRIQGRVFISSRLGPPNFFAQCVAGMINLVSAGCEVTTVGRLDFTPASHIQGIAK